MKPTVFISAGEVSGDMHASHLVSELRQHGEFQAVGMGGAAMAANGVTIIASLISQSTIGFFEPLRHLSVYIRTYFVLRQWLKKHRPSVMIAVDFQGFNVPLCRYAKSLGIPVVYYIAPQEWQWGSPAGGRRVVAATNLILSIFKQEHTFYSQLGGKSVFVGHPLMDIVPNKSKTNADDQQILSVFPGSRGQEIHEVLPIFAKTIARVKAQLPELRVQVSVAASHLREPIEAVFNDLELSEIEYVENDPYSVMRRATVSLACSGTVTLEHAIMATPMVVGYRFHPVSYRIGRILIGKKFDTQVKYIALHNIYLNREAIPEFLQSKCTPENLADACLTLLRSESERQAQIIDLETVRQLLGDAGAVNRAASEIHSILL